MLEVKPSVQLVSRSGDCRVKDKFRPWAESIDQYQEEDAGGSVRSK